MKVIFADHAWEDYLQWQTDKQALKRIHALIKDIHRSPFEGLGKPEPLKHQWAGTWSRRIDDKNRLVYRIRDGEIELIAIGSHYCDH